MSYRREPQLTYAWTAVFCVVCIIVTVALYWGITPRVPTTYDQCDAVFDKLMRSGAVDYTEYNECLIDVRAQEDERWNTSQR